MQEDIIKNIYAKKITRRGLGALALAGLMRGQVGAQETSNGNAASSTSSPQEQPTTLMNILDGFTNDLKPIEGFRYAPPPLAMEALMFYTVENDKLVQGSNFSYLFSNANRFGQEELTLRVAIVDGQNIPNPEAYEAFETAVREVMAEFNNDPQSRLKVEFVQPDYKGGPFLSMAAVNMEAFMVPEGVVGAHIAQGSWGGLVKQPLIIIDAATVYKNKNYLYKTIRHEFAHAMDIEHPFNETERMIVRLPFLPNAQFPIIPKSIPDGSANGREPFIDQLFLTSSFLNRTDLTVMDYTDMNVPHPKGWGVMDEYFINLMFRKGQMFGTARSGDDTYVLTEKDDTNQLIYETERSGSDKIVVKDGAKAYISFDPRYMGYVYDSTGVIPGVINSLTFPFGGNHIEKVRLGNERSHIILSTLLGCDTNKTRTISVGHDGAVFHMLEASSIGHSVIDAEKAEEPVALQFHYGIGASASPLPNGKGMEFSTSSGDRIEIHAQQVNVGVQQSNGTWKTHMFSANLSEHEMTRMLRIMQEGAVSKSLEIPKTCDLPPASKSDFSRYRTDSDQPGRGHYR